MKQISKAAGEVSNNIGRVAAPNQEVTSSMEEITNTTQVLDEMADKFKQTVNNFRV